MNGDFGQWSGKKEYISCIVWENVFESYFRDIQYGFLHNATHAFIAFKPGSLGGFSNLFLRDHTQQSLIHKKTMNMHTLALPPSGYAISHKTS